MLTPVERCTLAPGLDVSRAITGLWQVADMERNGGQLDLKGMAAAMLPYAEAGLTTFDMADHYGSAEDIAGLFMREFGGGYGIQCLTKWVPKPGAVSRTDVRVAVERSLERLGVSQLDLLQFHTWSYADPSWLDCLFWLQELKEEGLIAHLGLTNFDTVHLNIALASGIEIVSNQVCFSLLDQRPTQGMTELCEKYGIKLLAYGTVAGGFLSDRWRGLPDPGVDGLKTWSQMKYYRFIEAAGGWARFQKLLEILYEIAHHHEASVANIASRYILENAAVGGVIIGARLGNSAHIDDSLNLFKFSLDSESRNKLSEFLQTLDPIPGDSGDEYRKPPFLTASGDLSHHVDEFPAPYEVRQTPQGRKIVLSGTPWETMAGFCRAVQKDKHIAVSGTTATHRDRLIGAGDATAQFHFIVDKIEGVLQSLGASLEDIVRTRVFVNSLEVWEDVARAHGKRFASILPANTLVQAQLVGDGYLVEMEAEAVAKS